MGIVEIEPALTDDGQLFLAVGVLVYNSWTDRNLQIGAEDFLCAAIYGDEFNDFKVADFLIDDAENLISFPLTVPVDTAIAFVLAFQLPINTDSAVFAFPNIWGTDFSQPSYVFVL